MVRRNMKTYSLPELQSIAHEAFKLHWMISHGYTVADLLGLYSNYWGDVESDEEGMFDFWKWLDDVGFNGELWPCLNEFLDNEFKDVNLMHQLLSPDQYSSYLSLLGQIMANDDHPTKHLSDVKEGDVLLYDGCRYVATTDAYMANTDIGKEWNVEVKSDEGPEEYLYASYFHNGEVQFIPNEEVAA